MALPEKLEHLAYWFEASRCRDDIANSVSQVDRLRDNLPG
jgi:hypothetical protein